MSLPRPSGLKAPSKIGKPSGLPQPKSLEPDDIPPPADDFIIGDRVWVGGTKPGFIAFLGETQFGTGEWAGVVLDNFEGKNDGSVQGVRYFQCEPKRGIFARISKLSRTPDTLKTITPKPDDGLSEQGGNSVRNGSSNAKRGSIPHVRPTTPKTGLAPTHRNLSTSSSSLHKTSTPAQKPGLRLGDRVLVSGTKTGTLRYLGATDFAKGDWAGVELDEKQGKNDGAVAGKRYFECRPMFGLFAPVHKVAKVDMGTVASTPSPQTRSLMNTSLRLSRERSGSQESVSSISSTASSVSRSRVRLGVTSLGNQQKKSPVTRQSPALLQAKNSQRPSTLNLSATTSALQKALKEKEEHIEQLLKERDLERAEVARAAAQVDEAEGQLMNLRTENERVKEDQDEFITKLQRTIQELEKEKADLNCKLDDEKRKVEDLQFQIEEEAITKDDIELRTEADGAKFREIEKAAKKEKERADKLEQELITLQIQLKEKSERLNSTEDTNMTYLDQIEELTHKLSQAENKIRVYDSSRLEEGAKTSQVSMELAEKSARVTELEDILSTRNRDIKNLQNRLGEVEEELKSSTSSKAKMQQTIDRMTSDLNKGNDTSNQLRSEIQQMQTQLSELRRQLNSSKERTDQLTEEKNQLEQQMSEMMKNSGDSSQKLSILNEQVKDKTRKIEELQADLSSSTQKWEKLNEEKDEIKREKENELQGLKIKHDNIAKTIHNQLEDVQTKLDKANNKMKTMTEDFDKEKEDAISRKLSEINDLKKQLQQSKDELEKQEVQTQAHKQVLDKITMEKDALQFEKEKTEKLVKRLEAEKETLNTDLIHARVEMTKIKNDSEQIFGDKDKLNEQIQDLKAEIERLLKAKTEVVKEKEEAVSQIDGIMTERDNIQREVVKIRAEFQKKDIEMEELQKEVEKLRQENVHLNQSLALISQQESSNEVLNQQLETCKKALADLQSRFNSIEAERDSMKAQLEFTNLITEERKRLEDQNHLLSKELEELGERHRKEMEGLSASRDTLQNEVDNYTELLRQRSEELEEKKKQISNLKNDSSSLELYRSSVQKLEKERIELQDKINTLEKTVKETASFTPKYNNNNIDISLSGNSPAAKLKEDKEAADRQVDFLNSVIVDLQKKNQDLQTRLEVMESGVVTNGDADSSMENTTSSKRAPPRLFCDICDVFDKHDTDDCPLQAMDYDESPPPSQHHGDRKQMRPYCDICEEFHEQCKDSVTTNDSPSPLSFSPLQGDYSTSPTFGFGQINPLSVLFGSEIKGISKSDVQECVPLVTYNKSADVAIIDTCTYRENVNQRFNDDENDRLKKDKNEYNLNDRYHDKNPAIEYTDIPHDYPGKYPGTFDKSVSDQPNLGETESAHSVSNKLKNQQELLYEHDLRDTPVIIVEEDPYGNDDVNVYNLQDESRLKTNHNDSFEENETDLDKYPVLQDAELDEYKTFFRENELACKTNLEDHKLEALSGVNQINSEQASEEWKQCSKFMEANTRGTVEMEDPYISGTKFNMAESEIELINTIEKSEHVTSNQSQNTDLRQCNVVKKEHEKSFSDFEETISSPDVTESKESSCNNWQCNEHRYYSSDTEDDENNKEENDEGSFKEDENYTKTEFDGSGDVSMPESTALIDARYEIPVYGGQAGDNKNTFCREGEIFNFQTEMLNVTACDGGQITVNYDKSGAIVENESIFADQNAFYEVEDNQPVDTGTDQQVDDIGRTDKEHHALTGYRHEEQISCVLKRLSEELEMQEHTYYKKKIEESADTGVKIEDMFDLDLVGDWPKADGYSSKNNPIELFSSAKHNQITEMEKKSMDQSRSSTSDSEYLSENESYVDTSADNDDLNAAIRKGVRVEEDELSGHYLDSFNNYPELTKDEGNGICDLTEKSIDTSETDLVNRQGEKSDKRLDDDRDCSQHSTIQGDNTDKSSTDDKAMGSPDSRTVGSLDDKSASSVDDKDPESCRVS